MGAQTSPNRRPFIDLLVEGVDSAGSPICVGLDPVLEKLPERVRAEHWEPAAAIEAFSTGVIDAVAGIAPVVKLQSACYERYGAAGVRVLEHVAAHARSRGMLVLLDAKRGDIGISAEHYAQAAVGLHANAITVSGYLGPSTIEPYLRAGLGVFVLVRTSNPDSDVVQGVELGDGRSVAGMMGEMVAGIGAGWKGERGTLSSVGAVVGATKAADGRMLRERMPDQVFLVPGYGAQGGTAADVRALLRSGLLGAGESGVLVTASRSVIYPAVSEVDGDGMGSGDWKSNVRHAAERLASEIGSITRD
ncbi:MAG: orotidine-5'-phosphate decarboxylase [Phycisphaeraceae bacterium]|nr:orotidine-5'-phosphate decarboxylase [Phycisphaeraceae bacterium]MBX3367512.1 orotidine-5'-phosphate decarboxylase [Phycisphaeraceae bacterium]QYK47011.1 MAG: orotidine-5'-phosphate decarboxylase [Phycisphaeraceae bacterium]